MGKLFKKLTGNTTLLSRSAGAGKDSHRILDPSLKVAKGGMFEFMRKTRKRQLRAAPPMTIMGTQLGG